MDFLHFTNVSFLPNAIIGRLCEDLNNIVGHSTWYDTVEVQNTECLWLVNDIVTTIKSDKVLCGCLGLYPSYVAGILNSVKEIHFYVLCSKKLHYGEYIEKDTAGNKCSVPYTKHKTYFLLVSGGDKIALSFTARKFSEPPSEQIIAQSVLKRMRLSSLVYGFVCINKRVTCITNEVLIS